MPSQELYTFGAYALDVSERRLSKDAQVVALVPKAFDLLVALVRHAGRLVTKRDLLDEVWRESFVEEGILAVHVSTLRRAFGDDNRSPTYIETVSRSGYRFIAPVRRVELDPAAFGRRWSLAVLPARPLMTDEGPGPFMGLAMADALIDRLGRFEQIVVRPTRATQAYGDAQRDPADIGRSLHVDAVVDSSLHETADGIRVSAELVRSRDGACLWSGEFDEATTARMAVPDAVAESVAAHLGVRGGAVRTTDTAGPPRRPEVYEQVGRGRSYLLSASLVEMPNAEAAFRTAIELDPTYAAAHAGLALVYCAQAELRAAPVPEAYAQAKAAALRALAMDDTCADAQIALGAVLLFSEWDWVGAERSVMRALEINPNHTDAYLLYGRLLESRGKLDAGLDMKLRALERDPFSPLVHLQISMSYWNQRRYDDAIVWANKTLEIDPRHLLAREFLAGAYWARGDFDRHMAENVKHAESYGVPAEALEPLKQIYAARGRAGVVQHALERAREQPVGVPDFQLALLYGEAGDLDAAFRHLGLAMDAHDPCLVQLAVAPQWDSLRLDPRFNQCLARMGLSAAC